MSWLTCTASTWGFNTGISCMYITKIHKLITFQRDITAYVVYQWKHLSLGTIYNLHLFSSWKKNITYMTNPNFPKVSFVKSQLLREMRKRPCNPRHFPRNNSSVTRQAPLLWGPQSFFGSGETLQTSHHCVKVTKFLETSISMLFQL